jgi:hypothetical protein
MARVRWVVLHMVKEMAYHAGHLDSQWARRPRSRSIGEARAFSVLRTRAPDGYSTALCGWLELHVLAMLRAARPIVELGPGVAATDDRGGSVVGFHD